ncbi:Protein of unknown function (DUF1679) [Nesidiocoris tenuis]|uniref:CHK kinase-like domain-containing protein n=1 Tax=Nesidiocoris tenuis TaxID=355587 RepID=A0ABN7AU87_9HEMI|nr:Protein of unknown function (DUF1679) [Nesidiocoris tenuis]
MERNEAEIDVNWLELILRRKSYEESVVRVLDFQQNGELEKGENFMSKIRRIKAKVLLGSGTLKTVSYIVKTQHETENLKRMSVEFGLFFREITMYRDILPKMEALLDEAGITEERPWGKCVGVRLYDTLILEDLTMEGYKLVDRKKQLGLTAALLVIKVFGKFHALSRILLQRGDIPFDVFQKYMATKNGGENQFVCDGLKKLVKKCQEWGDEWDEATRRMRNILPHFGEKFNQALSTPTEFNVLVHCDAWPNNMLFKYDEDPENPTSVKLLDFQVGFICTPARDLHMFLTTSVRMEVRDKHLNTLIQAYADSLQSVLTKCNYTGEIPNADGVYEMLEKTEIFHFADSFSMALVALNDHESAPDYEEIVKHRREASEKGEELGEEYSLVRNMSPRATNIIQVAIKQAMKSGVI